MTYVTQDGFPTPQSARRDRVAPISKDVAVFKSKPFILHIIFVSFSDESPNWTHKSQQLCSSGVTV